MLLLLLLLLPPRRFAAAAGCCCCGGSVGALRVATATLLLLPATRGTNEEKEDDERGSLASSRRDARRARVVVRVPRQTWLLCVMFAWQPGPGRPVKMACPCPVDRNGCRRLCPPAGASRGARDATRRVRNEIASCLPRAPRRQAYEAYLNWRLSRADPSLIHIPICLARTHGRRATTEHTANAHLHAPPRQNAPSRAPRRSLTRCLATFILSSPSVLDLNSTEHAR